jgi:Fic family protein
MASKNLLIWQLKDWPKFTATSPAVEAALLQAHKWQGEVIGRAAAVGLTLGLTQSGSVLHEVMTQEVIATAAIEGEKLDPASVRSSILRQLGHLQTTEAAPRSRHVDGLVDVIQDTTLGFKQALTEDRLLRWQSALFPGGTSGIRRIAVGRYRDHSDLMQIVSGQPGKEVIHYTAPPSAQVPFEMQAFLAWFAKTAPQNGRMDGTNGLNGITRAAIAHLWFESIHPFEDGNGRIGRAIMDMALAQDLGETTRLYSLSSQLMQHRKGYYDALHQAQHGSLDVSAWVLWFTQQFSLACQATCALIDCALEKSTFWQTHSQTPLNERQRKVIQRLLDDGDGGFLGGLNADKYMKMTSTSKATATRDLADLVKNGLLRITGQGKAVRYFVAVEGWEMGWDSGAKKDAN